eukprot:403352243
MGCLNAKINENNIQKNIITPGNAPIQSADYRLIANVYTTTSKVLGTGNFGKVFLAKSISNPEFLVAIKTMPKKNLGDSLRKIKEEIKILAKLDHPNICKYYETYESPKHFYLVMEYCGGGDLFDKITSREEEMTEQKASQVMKKLFQAINHCHSNNVAHRDLKPENIMYSEDGNDIKIIDFGLSKLNHKKQDSMKTLVGTPYYVAPEVLQGQYGVECDNWSLGVIMYTILSGYLPFYGTTPAEVFQKIKHGEVSFKQEEFKKISNSAKDLITKLLNKDKNLRYSCFQALKHPWFAEVNTDVNLQIGLDPNVLISLRKYKGVSVLKKEAMSVLIKMLNSTEIESLRQVFNTIDKDQTGMINLEELQQALTLTGHHLTEIEIKQIIQNVDYAGNGKINYSEFLVATIELQQVLSYEKMWALFKYFDTDDSGVITSQNLKEAFAKTGKDLNDAEIAKIFEKHSFIDNGGLNFDEFSLVFFDREDENYKRFSTSSVLAFKKNQSPVNGKNRGSRDMVQTNLQTDQDEILNLSL